MNMRRFALVMLTAAVVCAAAAAKPADDGKKSDGTKNAAKKDEPPACMLCGATCGLVPTCICEPGTKKQPKVEFETTCEPICVPACGHLPWPLGDRHARVACSSCCDEPCRCHSRVRSCKKLKKETSDEEVSIVTRKVAYLCCGCAGKDRARCCGGAPQHRATWWSRSLHSLTWWWPREAAHSLTALP